MESPNGDEQAVRGCFQVAEMRADAGGAETCSVMPQPRGRRSVGCSGSSLGLVQQDCPGLGGPSPGRDGPRATDRLIGSEKPERRERVQLLDRRGSGYVVAEGRFGDGLPGNSQT